MEFIDFIPKTLQLALKHGGDFAEVFVEQRQKTSIILEENKLEEVLSGTDVGMGLRVISNYNTSYGYTNSMEAEGWFSLADVISNSLVGASNKEEPISLAENRGVLPSPHQPELATDNNLTAKMALVKLANEVARQHGGNIVQVRVVAAHLRQQVTVANSEGLLVTDTRGDNVSMVQVIAAANGLIQTAIEVIGGNAGFSLTAEKVTAAATEAAQRAALMLKAKPAPTGKMMVVLAGKAGGTMVHEAIGHGLEADLAGEGLSVYSGRLGKTVASPLVTIIDDPTMPAQRGSYNYDDEGEKPQPTVLVDKGILVGYLYDRIRAQKEGKKSTANGRRQNYRYIPIPRMSNTIIAPGNSNANEMMKTVTRGLLVTKLGGGQVNTVNGDFVFEISEGYLIENGETGHAIRGATLSGNGPKVLQEIEGVADDLGFAIGTCGKKGQLVPVSDGQPTLLIPQLLVGGHAS